MERRRHVNGLGMVVKPAKGRWMVVGEWALNGVEEKLGSLTCRRRCTGKTGHTGCAAGCGQANGAAAVVLGRRD